MEARPAVVQGRGVNGNGRAGAAGVTSSGGIDRGERRRGGQLARPRPRPVYEAAKRAVDVVGALALTALALPLFPLAAIAVRLSSPGPVIYRQTRIGRRGRPFTCLMFRTMVVDGDHLLEGRAPVDSQGGAWKPNPDPRVTPMGRWLRRRSIDELPQVVNVLRGEMSLVGPRPLQPEEVEERWGDRRALLLGVKPGLTALWQVSGRSLLSDEDRLALDMEYIRRRGFLYDLWLLARTIPAVLSGRGAV